MAARRSRSGRAVLRRRHRHARLSALDLLDGALARKTGTVTKFGAVFDSVLDRLSEAAVLGGLLYHFTQLGDHTEEIVLCYAAMRRLSW